MSAPFSFTTNDQTQVVRSDGKIVAEYDPDSLDITLVHSAFQRHAEEIETAVAVATGALAEEPGLPAPETPKQMAEAVLEPPTDPTMGRSGTEFIIWAVHHMKDAEFIKTYAYKKEKLLRRLERDSTLGAIPLVRQRIQSLPDPKTGQEEIILTPQERDMILKARAKAGQSQPLTPNS